MYVPWCGICSTDELDSIMIKSIKLHRVKSDLFWWFEESYMLLAMLISYSGIISIVNSLTLLQIMLYNNEKNRYKRTLIKTYAYNDC